MKFNRLKEFAGHTNICKLKTPYDDKHKISENGIISRLFRTVRINGN